MTKGVELIYSRQDGDFVPGRAYSNPRFFTSPRADVTKVYIVGDWPKIVDAYEALGVPVERLDEAPKAPAPSTAKAPASLVSKASDEERAKVYIPDDWASLPWSKPTDAGLTLRGLAAVFADVPVLNKQDAAKAIEAELARRAAAPANDPADEEGSNGLTRREMNADLEAAGAEIDPGLDIEALVARHAESKAAA